MNDAQNPRITAQTSICTKKKMVLLDGGASHNEYYSPSIPEGAIEKEVELAHGTKTGYVKGGDIIFFDESISEKKADEPAIISLGRLVKKGIRLDWTKKGAVLVLPNSRKIPMLLLNNCPCANERVIKLVKIAENR